MKHIGNIPYVFSLSAIGAGDLANQKIQAYNLTWSADQVKPTNNVGEVVDAFYFNKVANGNFDLHRTTTSYVTFDEPGDTASIIIDGSLKTVIIETLATAQLPNDIVKDTFTFAYHPGISAT